MSQDIRIYRRDHLGILIVMIVFMIVIFIRLLRIYRRRTLDRNSALCRINNIRIRLWQRTCWRRTVSYTHLTLPTSDLV